jgi:hypothetical protein
VTTVACACKKNKLAPKFKVKLAGGMTVTKGSEAEAREFAAKHPGSTVIKPSA